MARTLTDAQRMDQRLLTDFRKPIWRPFMQAIRQYRLIQPGDRIAQLVILPFLAADFDETDALPQTDRGAGGFGSTGMQ